MELQCPSIFWILTLITCLHCQDFGYDGSEGPSHWGDKYRQCVGKHQSPIDIDYHKVKEVQLPKLKFNFLNKNIGLVKLLNNGHTVKLMIVDGVIPTMNGGPLNGTYEFDHLHFHWGPNDTIGSENKINNASFPLEMHMLFYNKYYQDALEASKYGDGYCVLSFLYTAAEKPNRHFDSFERGLKRIRKTYSTTNLSTFGSLEKFANVDKNKYFTYQGSLTTPPCSEVVTWIEFREVLPIAHHQLQEFRNLIGSHGKKLNHNYRPTQNINDRIILYNHSTTSVKTTFILFISLLLLIF